VTTKLWCAGTLQLGTVIIPKSVTPSRIAANIDLLGFELTHEAMRAVARQLGCSDRF
jgi:diketogulonate reductase-like aldo/keto reductase